MSEFIFTSSGEPFETEQAAKMRAGVLKKEGIVSTPIEHESGGWVLMKEKTERVRQRYKFWEEPNPMMIDKSLLDPKFEYRVCNDDTNFWRNRISTLKRASWEVVSGDISMNDGALGMPKQIGGVVAQPVGKDVRGILMGKPKDWYKEDYASKQGINDEIMAQIKAQPGTVDGGAQAMPVVMETEVMSG